MFAPQVSWINLDGSAGVLSRNGDCLNAREVENVDSFATPLLRQRALGARIFLRSVLSHFTRSNPKDHRITLNPYGKPEMANGPFFNLSHSDAWAVIAIHQTRPVGIDVERAGRAIDASAFDGLLSSSEQQDQSDRELSNDDHLRLWTRKEATSKALGYGLHIDFSDLDVGYSEHTDKRWKTIATPVDDMPMVQLADLTLPTGEPIAVALASSQKIFNRPRVVGVTRQQLFRSIKR